MKTYAANASSLLIVEDNEADFETITLLLAEAGLLLPIVHCQTGEQALEFLKNQKQKPPPEREIPAHILLDLNLPGVSGQEVLRALREDSLLKPIPVTILTTSSHPRDINGCYREGANSYLIKPVDFERFQKMLREFAVYWFEIAQPLAHGEAYA